MGHGEGAGEGAIVIASAAKQSNRFQSYVGAYRDTPSPNPGTDLRTGAARHALYFTI